MKTLELKSGQLLPKIPAPKDMTTDALKTFIAQGANDLYNRREALKPYYLKLRSRLSQKEWSPFLFDEQFSGNDVFGVGGCHPAGGHTHEHNLS